jgi:ABC-type polar amino acid transport system ATPase subunit
MLSGKNIEKVFGNARVLENIDIEVSPGTVTALIGPSGAGKSTLIRALSLVDPPSRGEIVIDGTSHLYPKRGGDNSPSPWPDVTVVFQQLFLWPHLTLKQNIELPLCQRRQTLSQGYANELAEFFGLKECIDRLPYEVSIGQRQRGAIVRALALRPKYLFLDEVTSALDVEQVGKLAE